MFQSAWSMYNRLDYEWADMARGDRAMLGASHRAMPKEDRDFLQAYMNKIYEVFVERVAVTRKLPASEVRKIAEGRVWTGRDALEIGLVDELGGLAEAIDAARELANIPPSAELKIVHYPRPSSLGEIFESMSGVTMGGLTVNEAWAALAQGLNAARPVSFEEQLMMFSQRLQPLCWMAIPDLLEPAAPLATEAWPPSRFPGANLPGGAPVGLVP
jgi:ClpP class serine protease